MRNTEIYFEITTPLRVKIRTTKQYWDYLINIKHKVMEGKKKIVKEVLFDPDEIRKSRTDKDVFLYYKKIDKLYCVVTKHEGEEGFLITAYPTDKVKEGEVIWIK